MAKKKESSISVTSREIESAIHVVRGNRVMLDGDLARLYGVTTSALNQAVKRNLERFPADFAYQLTKVEDEDLRSQFVISKTNQGGRRYLSLSAEKVPVIGARKGTSCSTEGRSSPF